MVFSSLLFLFKFLPAFLLVYYVVPQRAKNLVIFLGSLIFYTWGEVRYFPVMMACIVVNYAAALLIGRFRERGCVPRAVLAAAVVISLGMLAFFKYTDFFIQNFNAVTGLSVGLLELTLPLGISFYTFQTMSYTIDVYRGKVPAERNFINVSAFVTMFPQLIAGPIVRYTDIARELKERKLRAPQMADGVRMFVLGLGKKVLIANNIGMLWTEVESIGFANVSSPLAWLGIFAFTLQIYFDFSGYSQMAIGLGKLMGFEFPENFDFPYIAKSVTEFWRRWHITLSSWFREYLYFPLGGSRRGEARTYLNLFIVWAATGFWHGASWNFIFWGLYFFVLRVIERLWLEPKLQKGRVWPHFYLMFAVVVSWAIFAVTDLGQLGVFFGRLFGFSGGTDWFYYLRSYAGTFIVGIVCAVPAARRFLGWIRRFPPAELIVYLLIFLLSLGYLVDATYNPFLYFRF